MLVTLVDDSDATKTVAAEVIASNGQLWIKVAGYGDAVSVPGKGIPIALVYQDGHLKVLCWTDINSEEPAIIYMNGALEGK